jgi:DinB family protein
LGFPESLSSDASGAELDDDASAALPLPGKDDMLAYVRPAFAALEEVLGQLKDAELLDRCADVFDDPSNVADFFLFELSHGSRHLGMVEALKGIYGGHGTVTV